MATPFKFVGERLRLWIVPPQKRPSRKRNRRCRPTLEFLENRSLLTAAAATLPAIGDVFYIEMENHNLTQPSSVTSPQQLQGNPAAPYLNSLMTPGNPNAAQTSFASKYYNADYNNPAVSIHPSEPNYVWQEGGNNFGVFNDADPYANNGNPNPNLNNNVKLIAATGSNPANLSALLQNAGISWKSYQEDIDLANGGSVNQPASNSLTSTVAPQDQWTVPTSSFSGTSAAYTNGYNGSHQYNFAVKHDGQLFYTATNGGTLSAPDFSPSNPEAQHYAPLQQLQTDLNNNAVAPYNQITPDQFNDMHSSLNTNFTYNGVTYTHNTDQESIALGDNFLSQIVPMIEASQAYKNNGAIVIWYDETEGGNSTSFTVPEIVISPLAKGHAYDSTLTYTHSSDLKSMQELFNVPAPGGGFLGDANTPGTNDLTDFFQQPPGASVQVTTPGTLLNLVGGDTNDQLNVTPIGSAQDGSTGVQVTGKLDNININQTFTGITQIYVAGFNGNDNIQFAPSLTIPTIVSEGDGNDQVQLGNGNGNTVTIYGNGNDQVKLGDGNGDSATINGNGNNQVQAGDGRGDSATINGSGNNQIKLGDGNGNSASISGNGNNQIKVGNGTGDFVSLSGNGNDDVKTGTGSGTAVVTGTGHKNIHFGSDGWSQGEIAAS